MDSSYSLLCSASGTDLSRVSAFLEAEPWFFNIVDVESLWKRSTDWQLLRYSGAVGETVGSICNVNIKEEVVSSWRNALNEALDELRSQAQGVKVLACHLTLFSGKRQEFYVTASPLSFMDFKPSQVVMLIDDVYDMTKRLSGAGDVYREEYAINTHTVFSTKASKIKRDLLPDEKNLLKIETRLKIASRLLFWRKSEIIAAESLASALNIPFRVVGIKHPKFTIARILCNPELPAIYISHKISELRRSNREKPEEWDEFAYEVNALSEKLDNVAVSGIQPTAIDELRFGSPSPGSLIDRPLSMTPRWPKNENMAYEGDPDHLCFFDNTFHTEKFKQTAIGILRHFESTVFDEIAFRDHLLVRCNDGLLVYRPLAFPDENGFRRLSSGVRREVEHWALQYLDKDQGSPGTIAVFIHLASELLEHLPSKAEVLKNLIITQLQNSGLSPETAEKLWENRTATSDHLGRITGLEDPLKQLNTAATTALAKLCLQAGGDVPFHGIPRAFLVVSSSRSELDASINKAGKLFSTVFPSDSADMDNLRVVNQLIEEAGVRSAIALCDYISVPLGDG